MAKNSMKGWSPMIYIIDEKVNPGTAVRALLYTEESDLTGETVATENGGTVTCAVGSIAMKAGFADMKQLGADGWVAC